MILSLLLRFVGIDFLLTDSVVFLLVTGAAVLLSRLLQFLVVTYVSREAHRCLFLFASNLIFALELHQVTLFSAYVYESGSGRTISLIGLLLALYYLLAWSADYCASQYLAAHYVRLPADFFGRGSREGMLEGYVLVAVEIAAVVLLFTPLSGLVLTRLVRDPCAVEDLRCLVCHHHQEENLWLAGSLEFAAAFLVGGPANSFEEVPVVTLASLFRLFFHSLAAIFGYDVIFLGIIPAASVTLFALCRNEFHWLFPVVHWLSPLLGSFCGWLFFHRQRCDSADDCDTVIKTSVTSLARVQSQDSVGQDRSRASRRGSDRTRSFAGGPELPEEPSALGKPSESKKSHPWSEGPRRLPCSQFLLSGRRRREESSLCETSSCSHDVAFNFHNNNFDNDDGCRCGCGGYNDYSGFSGRNNDSCCCCRRCSNDQSKTARTALGDNLCVRRFCLGLKSVLERVFLFLFESWTSTFCPRAHRSTLSSRFGGQNGGPSRFPQASCRKSESKRRRARMHPENRSAHCGHAQCRSGRRKR